MTHLMGKISQHAFKAIKHLTNTVCIPIKGQLVFFILCFLLLAPSPLTSIFVYFGNISYIRGTITGITGAIAWAYIFTAIGYIIKTKLHNIYIYIYNFLIFSLLSLLFITYFVLYYRFERYINPSELALVFNTTPTEAKEFISTYFGINHIIYFLLASTLGGIIYFNYTKIQLFISRQLLKLSNNIRFFLKLIITVLLIFGFIDLYYVMNLCRHPENLGTYWRIDDAYADNLSKIIYSTTAFFTVNKKTEEWANKVNGCAFESECVTKSASNLKIVLIIGESYICSHSPLYGYIHNTTPSMVTEAKKGNLLVFSNAVTPYIGTTDNIRNILTATQNSTDNNWYKYPFFPILFAKAGWNVNYWDNQTSHSGDTFIHNFSLMEFLFNDFLRRRCYTNLYKHPFKYDGQLIDNFISEVPADSLNELSIFHLYGQHFAQSKRYPNKDKKFRIFDNSAVNRTDAWMTDEKRNEIGHYDNATYYNDYVISKLFERYHNDNAIIIYFSDHGEEMYDYRNSKGRVGCPDNKKAQFMAQNHVPYFIWMTDKYMAMQPETAARLRAAVNMPIISTDAAHLIMGLAKMDTPYYKAENDLSSPNFKTRPRIVNGGYDYDQITK